MYIHSDGYVCSEENKELWIECGIFSLTDLLFVMDMKRFLFRKGGIVFDLQ